MARRRVVAKQPHPLQPQIGFNRRLVGAALALSVVTGAYILCHFPIGIPGEWWTQYRTHFPSVGAVGLFAAAMAVFVAAAALFDRFLTERGPAARALAVVFSTVLAVAMLFASAACGPQGSAELVAPSCMYDGPGLFQREAARIADAEDGRAEFVLPGTDAAGQAQALEVTGARDYLARFPLILSRYAEDYRKTVRVNNNPPGTTMVFYAAFRLAEVAPGLSRIAAGPVFGWGFQPPSTMSAGTLLGSWVLLVGAALAFVPAYLVASRMMGKPAFLVAALASLAGSALLFVPGKDTLQIFFFLWMFYFFLR
ncbi:MAG: hypothetical protein J7M19_02250, partial [Planctomycetes bacterium]|nr:hypothetical protein [Planctomycetota bacterium]